MQTADIRYGSNTNCLEGLCCPECGQDSKFRVRATSVFNLYDDGTDHDGDVEYDDDAFVSCDGQGCSYEGKLRDFRIENQVKSQCDNCGTVWADVQLTVPILDLGERVDAGGVVPSGECPDPECRALCYPFHNGERVDLNNRPLAERTAKEVRCPKCGSPDHEVDPKVHRDGIHIPFEDGDEDTVSYICKSCGARYTVTSIAVVTLVELADEHS